MTPVLGIAALTALEQPPPALIGIASRLGCAAVGVRVYAGAIGGPSYLIDDAPLLRETLAAIADTGVRVFDIEFARLAAETTPETFEPMLAIGQALGAQELNVTGYDPEPGRLVDKFARLCELAARHGLNASLEFMPWSKVPDLATAASIVRQAGQPNGGVLIDALHMARCGSTLAEIETLPRHWLRYFQICDAPAAAPPTMEGLIHAGRAERLSPGEGGLDLAGMLRRMPPGVPVCIEVPSETLARTLSDEARCARAVHGARAVLERLAAA